MEEARLNVQSGSKRYLSFFGCLAFNIFFHIPIMHFLGETCVVLEEDDPLFYHQRDKILQFPILPLWSCQEQAYRRHRRSDAPF